MERRSTSSANSHPVRRSVLGRDRRTATRGTGSIFDATESLARVDAELEVPRPVGPAGTAPSRGCSSAAVRRVGGVRRHLHDRTVDDDDVGGHSATLPRIGDTEGLLLLRARLYATDTFRCPMEGLAEEWLPVSVKAMRDFHSSVSSTVAWRRLGPRCQFAAQRRRRHGRRQVLRFVTDGGGVGHLRGQGSGARRP